MRARTGPRGVRASLRRADGDPLALLVGLFDGALVLALAVALRVGAPAPGAAPADAEPADEVPVSRETLPRYREAEGQATGEGSRLGIAYRLANGEVVFVPDASTGR